MFRFIDDIEDLKYLINVFDDEKISQLNSFALGLVGDFNDEKFLLNKLLENFLLFGSSKLKNFSLLLHSYYN